MIKQKFLRGHRVKVADRVEGRIVQQRESSHRHLRRRGGEINLEIELLKEKRNIE